MPAPQAAADPAQGASRLAIQAERCVHAQVLHAGCQACVTACPRQAWRAHPDGLGFDAEACDDCGLCVAACPTDALALPAREALPIHPVQIRADGCHALGCRDQRREARS